MITRIAHFTVYVTLAAIIAACVSAPGNGNISIATQSSAEAPDGAIRAVPMASAPLDSNREINRIIFASCAHQREDQTLWDLMAKERADLTLYIGDNVYGDVRSNDPAMPELKAAYMRLAQSEPFSRLRKSAPMLVTWDDHDYGMNDGGGDYQYKEQAEALFEYVWAFDENDPRRTREGVYHSWMLGAEQGRRLQIIMLDTRFFRSPLKRTDDYGAQGKERYVPDQDREKTMLGAAQWAWLEEELKQPADLRLLVSSVQIIADGHGWEAWKMLPAERTRLYELINQTGAQNIIILSGDRHSASLYRKPGVVDYPLFEATSSSVNLPAARWREQSGETYVEPGPNRISDMYFEANYGLLEIDWQAGSLTVSIRDESAMNVFEEQIDFRALQ